jgi:hypothetical protein
MSSKVTIPDDPARIQIFRFRFATGTQPKKWHGSVQQHNPLHSLLESADGAHEYDDYLHREVRFVRWELSRFVQCTDALFQRYREGEARA